MNSMTPYWFVLNTDSWDNGIFHYDSKWQVSGHSFQATHPFPLLIFLCRMILIIKLLYINHINHVNNAQHHKCRQGINIHRFPANITLRPPEFTYHWPSSDPFWMPITWCYQLPVTCHIAWMRFHRIAMRHIRNFHAFVCCITKNRLSYSIMLCYIKTDFHALLCCTT